MEQKKNAMKPKEIQDLIERGLEFLRSQQNIEGFLNEPCSNAIPSCMSGKLYGVRVTMAQALG